MKKVIKRMSPIAVTLAIMFLLVQIGCNLYLPILTANMVDRGIAAGDNLYIRQQGFWMMVLTVCSLVGALLNTLITSKISYRLGSRLREEIYQKVLQFSKVEFDKIGTASLITRNTNDVTQVQTLVEMGLKFLILAPMYLIGGIALTWTLDSKLALVLLSCVPFLIFAAWIIYRGANPLYSKIQKLVDKLNLYFREGLTGVKVIRAFNKEAFELQKYDKVNREYTEASIKAGTLMGLFAPLITLLMGVATTVVVWVGAGAAAAGTMEIGAIIAAISYSAQILLGFKILSMVILAVPKGQVSAERIHEVLEMPLSIVDGEGEATNTAPAALVFETIDFRYPGAERKALEGISFSVKPGQTLAIIGSTGDGKTTMANLISRLYDVDCGRVCIDGMDVREMNQHMLRDLVSYVPQQNTLFFGTIRSNMLLGNPQANDDEIWQALEVACAKDFVKCLDAGLDSTVEKSGGNFSGGQKQRLCIARALLKKAHIYLFDDSFSALDFKTDAMVRKNMSLVLQNVITVIVAQRISTVMQADIIAVLDKGKLAGLGTHKQLKASNTVYQEMIQSQFDREAAV